MFIYLHALSSRAHSQFSSTKLLKGNMVGEQRHGVSGPHWTGDGSSVIELDGSSSYRVPVKALSIIWGNDPRYWQWITLSEDDARSTGFKEGATLLQVNWIEVTGKVPLSTFKISSSARFGVYFTMKFQVDAFGWHSVPIKFKVKVNGEETVRCVVMESYREKHDQWHEIYGGEFTVKSSRDGDHVEFGMFEVESEWWKGSMVLAGITIKTREG